MFTCQAANRQAFSMQLVCTGLQPPLHQLGMAISTLLQFLRYSDKLFSITQIIVELSAFFSFSGPCTDLPYLNLRLSVFHFPCWATPAVCMYNFIVLYSFHISVVLLKFYSKTVKNIQDIQGHKKFQIPFSRNEFKPRVLFVKTKL